MPSRAADRRVRYGLLAAAVLYALALCVIVVQRAESSSDFRDFWRTARHFLDSGEVRSDLGVHNYLPVFTILVAPLALLPLPAAIVLFTLTSLAAFAATVWMVERELNPSAFQSAPPRPAVLAAVVLMLPYVTSCGVLGAFGLILTFLSVLAWRQAVRRSDWLAGAALGLAALLKLLPGLLIGYYLLRGRWRVAGGAALLLASLGLGLPWVALGGAETLAQYRAFRERAVQGHSAYETIHADKPLKANYSNSALPIVLRRLLSPVDCGKQAESDDGGLYVNLADWPGERIWLLYLALMGGLGGVTVLLTLAAMRTGDGAGERLRWVFGSWCCLMLLASPLVWTHYLPLAYLPLALVADRGQRVHDATGRPDPAALLTMLAWLACAILLVWPAARAAGVTLLSVAILWLACVREAARRPGPAADPLASAT